MYKARGFGRERRQLPRWSMIPKSGYQFSEKVMLSH
jgi:hypothetical protein